MKRSWGERGLRQAQHFLGGHNADILAELDSLLNSPWHLKYRSNLVLEELEPEFKDVSATEFVPSKDMESTVDHYSDGTMKK